MSVSEQQTDLDAVVDELREFEMGDTVTLATDTGSITARVRTTEWDADTGVVTLADADADRRVRVTTERYHGWLDPLVDASPPNDSLSDDDPGLRRPIGTLVDVRLVVAAADRNGRYGRP